MGHLPLILLELVISYLVNHKNGVVAMPACSSSTLVTTLSMQLAEEMTSQPT